MPKKHTRNLYNKPLNSVHPSLLPSSSKLGKNGPSASSESSSVNELIQQLRRVQASSAVADGKPLDNPNMPSVHPSLRHILQIPDTPAPRPRAPIRQRVRGGVRAPEYRGLAGPAAPRSWAEESAATQREREDFERASHVQQKPRTLDRLPGIQVPRFNSLLDLALKSLARDWIAQAHYNQHYLATLPKHLKETLLSYIAVYGPSTGVTSPGLKILFHDASEVPGATDAEDITHLDLAGSLNSNLPETLTLSKLGQFLSKSLPPPTSPTSAPASTSPTIPDSWDDSPTRNPPSQPFSSFSSRRFPSLTHLSLSHAYQASWPALLEITPHLKTLTHLSLAYWPQPNFNIPILSTKAPQALSSYKSSSDNPTQVLRKLAQGTQCLKWLDVSGCADWIHLLSPTYSQSPNFPNFLTNNNDSKFAPACTPDASTDKGVDWVGSWGAIETIIAINIGEVGGEGEELPIPPARLWDDYSEHVMRVGSHPRKAELMERRVREMRRAVGGKGIQFVVWR